jgi:hypothetical protein
MSEETTKILDQVGGYNYAPRGIVHLKVNLKVVEAKGKILNPPTFDNLRKLLYFY